MLLLIFLHFSQLNEMDNIKLITWNLTDKVIRSKDEYQEIDDLVCCYIFQRNEDDDGGMGLEDGHE